MKGIVVMLLLVVILISSGCVNQYNGETNSLMNSSSTGKNISYSDDIEKVEVIHFHGNHQCQGCINVGKCAEDALNEYFQAKMKSDLVVFTHVNVDLLENTEIVQQYGASGSSLWIGVYGKDGSFAKEQNIKVWYKTSDMEKCREYIKTVIEEKLGGA